MAAQTRGYASILNCELRYVKERARAVFDALTAVLGGGGGGGSSSSASPVVATSCSPFPRDLVLLILECVVRLPPATAAVSTRGAKTEDELFACVVLDSGAHRTRLGVCGDDAPWTVWHHADPLTAKPEAVGGTTDAAAAAAAVGAGAGADTTHHSSGYRWIDPDVGVVERTRRWEHDMAVALHRLRHGVASSFAVPGAAQHATTNAMRYGDGEWETTVVAERAMRDPTDRNWLWCEEPLTSRDERERIAELLFEGDCAADRALLANAAVLSLYSTGRVTGMSVMVGYEHTYAVPVWEGYAMTYGTRCARGLGGRAVTRAMRHLLQSHDGHAAQGLTFLAAQGIQKRYSFVAEHGHTALLLNGSGSGSGASGSGSGGSEGASGSGSAAACARPLNPRLTGRPYWEGGPANPKKTETLPDGKTLSDTAVAPWACFEPFFDARCRYDHDGDGRLLFDAAALAHADTTHTTHTSDTSDSTSGGRVGSGSGSPLVQLLLQCSAAIDPDARRDVEGNRVLCGAPTLADGFAERTTRELERAYATALASVRQRTRVIASPERAWSVWIGGSILTSLSTSADLYVDKTEYWDVGPPIVHRKCLLG